MKKLWKSWILDDFSMGHSTPNRTFWKILIFDFLHFLKFFGTCQKTLSGNFWNFFDRLLKRYRISGFRSWLLQKWSKFKFFFLKFCFFTYKKLFKLFLYAILYFENFNLVFETVLILCTYSSIFLIIFYFKFLFLLRILRAGW